MVRRTVLPFCALALAACAAPRYTYVPPVRGAARILESAEADYRVPPGTLPGDLVITSLGLTLVRPEGAPEKTIVRALHARMVVANRNTHPWTFDTHAQRAVLPSGEQLWPAYASAQTTTERFVEIPPGDMRAFDLFFALPPTLQKVEKIPVFDVLWEVETGTPHAAPAVGRVALTMAQAQSRQAQSIPSKPAASSK